MAKELLYGVWGSMITRCNNPNREEYKRYGGRGIKVCDEWRDYNTFKQWAYANGYKIELSENNRNNISLDRIDNDGDYCPENCRFVNKDIQNFNKQTTVLHKYNGELYTSYDLAKMANIPVHTMTARLGIMRVERAMALPYNPRDKGTRNKPKMEYYGYYTSTQVCEYCKITDRVLRRLVEMGKINRTKFGNRYFYAEKDIKQLKHFYDNTDKYEWNKYSNLNIKTAIVKKDITKKHLTFWQKLKFLFSKQ